MHVSQPSKARDFQQEILRYLASHPEAADTCEGIEAWWLSDGEAAGRKDDLRAALEELIRQSRLTRKVLPGGAVIYHSTHRKP